jgi:hypothetical protein
MLIDSNILFQLYLFYIFYRHSFIWNVEVKSMTKTVFMVSLALMNITGLKSRSVANGNMKPAELKGHLTSVPSENIKKDTGFVSCERSSILKRWDTSKISIWHFTKTFSWSIIYSWLANCQTKEAPYYWRAFGKDPCTGKGRAGLWTGAEETTGNGTLVKWYDTF